MSTPSGLDPTHWAEALRPFVAGRPWIVSSEVLAGTTGMARALRELGAARRLCVGVVAGTGPLPAEDGADQVLMDLPLPRDMMGAIHQGERWLCAPPAWVQEAVDHFDPAGEARVVAPFFASGCPQLGRPVFGARRPEWRALEDKVVCDALFEAAGVAVAPWRVVPVEEGALRSAAAEVDAGAGTVWAGDAREGFHGGAALTFWVRGEGDAALARERLGARCDRARVMPFLDGVPCSIHGMVLPDGDTLAFRPCEMLVLRRPAGPPFAYAQAATTWDPPPADRSAMREVARRVGRWLRDERGYRGVFTVDGVMTAGGFLPTELNPRYGAAMALLAPQRPEVPKLLLHFAAVEGLALDWQGAALERLVVASSDAQRHAGFAMPLGAPVQERRDLGLVQEGGAWRLVREGEEPHAEGLIGPGPMGGFLRVGLRPERVVAGPSFAPQVAAICAALDRELGLGIGPLEAAPDLRAG